MHALGILDVARELGRSEAWVARNYQRLVDDEGMPAPIHASGLLAWSAPGFYAWLDRDLPPALQARAAAFRAAYEAAAAAPAEDLTQARARLDKRFAQKESA